MKSIVMPNPKAIGTVQLEEEVKNQLTEEVKETTVTNEGGENLKQITLADMWNLQRKSRSASDMMRRWNLN